MVKDPNPMKSVEDLLKGIEAGEYVIPNFQRKYEWNPGMVSDLLVSIMQDYFTGLLLFWELPDHLAVGEWNPLWGAEAPENPFFAILDGQQRLSSLYYSLYSPNKEFPDRSTYYLFYLNLDEYLEGNYEESIYYKFSKSYVSLDEIKSKKVEWINQKVFPLALLQDKEFLNNEFKEWTKSYTEKYVKKNEENFDEFFDLNGRIQDIRKIMDYTFVTHTLGKDRNLSDICGIFAKINQSGMRLSTFDLMNAFLFPKGIKLRNLWENKDKNDLKKIDKNMNEYILKLISLYKQDYCSSKYVFYLIPGYKITKKQELEKITLVKDSAEFLKLWNSAYRYSADVVEKIRNVGKNAPIAFGAIKSDFIQNKTIIPVMGAILWKFNDIKNKNKLNEKDFLDLLSRWYWHALVSGDYSGSSDSIMSEDYRDFKKWFITQNEWDIRRLNKVKREDIEELDLKSVKRGNSLYKVILSLLSLKGAEDFYTGWPLWSVDFKGERIHDHHIFPKNVKGLLDNSIEFEDTNDSILNRTLLLDKTNEIISNKKPSKYIKEIKLDETKIIDLMDSHLISNNALEHLRNDDYGAFIQEREISIKERLIEVLQFKEDNYEKGDSRSIEWSNYDLIKYLDASTKFQKLFLAALVQSDNEPIVKEEVFNLMNEIGNKKLNENNKINGFTIAGVRSGFKMRRKTLKKEDIIDSTVYKGNNYYMVKSSYKDIVIDWTKQNNLWILND